MVNGNHYDRMTDPATMTQLQKGNKNCFQRERLPHWTRGIPPAETQQNLNTLETTTRCPEKIRQNRDWKCPPKIGQRHPEIWVKYL